MTKAVFEVAALADALAKANKIAPSRGEAFEKASGILIDVSDGECVIMSTDTINNFSTWITPESFEGDPTTWRVPSRMFSDVIGKLKVIRNKTITFEQKGNVLHFAHGKTTRGQFNLIPHDNYPRFSAFSPDDMHEIEGLGGAVAAVAWGAQKNGDPPLTGVHLDGEMAITTDRYRFVSAPCDIKLDEPLTIPAHAIMSLIRPNEKVLFRSEGKKLYIMPDEFTQISLTAYGDDYPPIRGILRRDFPYQVTIRKAELAEAIELASTMIGSERMPTLFLIFGRQQVAAMMQSEGQGLVGHVVEVPEQLDFTERIEIRLNPDNIVQALAGAPGMDVTIKFDPDNDRAPVYIDGGGDGIEYWVAPRAKSTPTASDE